MCRRRWKHKMNEKQTIVSHSTWSFATLYVLVRYGFDFLFLFLPLLFVLLRASYARQPRIAIATILRIGTLILSTTDDNGGGDDSLQLSKDTVTKVEFECRTKSNWKFTGADFCFLLSIHFCLLCSQLVNCAMGHHRRSANENEKCTGNRE